MRKLPSLSIVTNLYNPDLFVFQKSLESIKKQNYPKELIEHLTIDAGSNNGSLELARRFGVTIIKEPNLVLGSQRRMSVGIKKARGGIILIDIIFRKHRIVLWIKKSTAGAG